MNLLKRDLGGDIDVISEHGSVNSSERVLIDMYPDYKIIGFVGNPWARILSWYSLINKWNEFTIEESRKEYHRFLDLRLAAKPDDSYFHYNHSWYFFVSVLFKYGISPAFRINKQNNFLVSSTKSSNR